MRPASLIAATVVTLTLVAIVAADVPLRPKKAACSGDRGDIATGNPTNGSMKAVGELDEPDFGAIVDSPTGVTFRIEGLSLNVGGYQQFPLGTCVSVPSGGLRCESIVPYYGKAKLKPVRSRPPAVRFTVRQAGVYTIRCAPGPTTVKILYGPSGAQTVHSATLSNCTQSCTKTLCTD